MPSFSGREEPTGSAAAAAAIKQRFLLLETHPDIGRPHTDEPGLRELPIPFGDSGYVALYQFIPGEDAVFVLAFRHQKEAGY